jgi:pimeloyl-ACP methyl ester carboxylesterase
LEFKEKQFDGPYEVAGIDITNERELFKGVVYFPPKSFKKPYPLVIYFHGFPHLFTLQEIVRSYSYLLDMGYSFIAFNFRGYKYSQGKVSIEAQVSDGLKVLNFIEQMAENDIFNLKNINILAHDFGAYIALILCSKTQLINNLILVSPILDLNRHVNNADFSKVLHYLNRFLPGNVQGIEDVSSFIEMTKEELSSKEFQIEDFISKLKNKKFTVISGEEDKITPVSEVETLLKNVNLKPDITYIECMDHECGEDEEIEMINEEIKRVLEKI